MILTNLGPFRKNPIAQQLSGVQKSMTHQFVSTKAEVSNSVFIIVPSQTFFVKLKFFKRVRGSLYLVKPYLVIRNFDMSTEKEIYEFRG